MSTYTAQVDQYILFNMGVINNTKEQLYPVQGKKMPQVFDSKGEGGIV